MNKRTFFIINFIVLFFLFASFGQKIEPDRNSEALYPKNFQDFSIDYDLILPSNNFDKWENEYIKHFEIILIQKINNSIVQFQQYEKLHARLDTSTIITNPKQIIGIWKTCFG